MNFLQKEKKKKGKKRKRPSGLIRAEKLYLYFLLDDWQELLRNGMVGKREVSRQQQKLFSSKFDPLILKVNNFRRL